VILSLWRVPDEPTRDWMRELYRSRFSGETTAAAVRSASTSLLKERRERGLSTHPFLWGAFVGAGDWR
jgi:CHAT domain-containing protein